MVLLAVSHDLFLVLASMVVSLVAAFSGLAITNNIGALPEVKRKTLVVMSAFILGSGIWSMHFVGMLAHEFPVPIYYDSLQTLGSALIAILVAGASLLLLHFSSRTQRLLNLAGLLLGAGVIVMHYVGMYAIRGMTPIFTFSSVVVAVLVAAVAGVIAVRVAYGERTKQNIILGATVFGLAVAVVHYAAMMGTSFQMDDHYEVVPVVMAGHALAVTVSLASFVICGSFLLATTTFVTQSSSSSLNSPARKEVVTEPNEVRQQAPEQEQEQEQEHKHDSPLSVIKIPFEKNKEIEFLALDDVAAVRADGHYTQLYTRSGVHFCPWPISQAEETLAVHGFHRTHRSYLVNVCAVDAFERRKETGVCLFENYPGLSSVPVSRNRVIGLTQVLDAQRDLIGT